MRIEWSSGIVDDQAKKDIPMGGRLGVVFHTEPTNRGSVTITGFDDNCGNLIHIDQV